MKFIPAIDLKDNRCVRLQKGKEEKSTVYNDDPIKQAKYFESHGCNRVHVVDLDGAFGRKNINTETILKIRKAIDIPIELGGGIKNEEDIDFWINNGIDFLIVGSLAIKNKELVLELSKKFKNKIYVAIDVLENTIMIKGWLESTKIKANDVFEIYNSSAVNGYIITDISRDGMLEGLNMDLIKKITLKTKKNIIVGGGLSNYEDLYNLNKIKTTNLEGVIAGKSFYSGKIAINKALEIFGKNA